MLALVRERVLVLVLALVLVLVQILVLVLVLVAQAIPARATQRSNPTARRAQEPARPCCERH